MKLTPEQQVFYRYGYVKACLYFKILKARDYALDTYRKSYDKLTPDERADCRKKCQIEFLINRVRDRRAACRGWIPNHERKCSNCKFYAVAPCKYPCNKCNSHSHNNWVPSTY